MDKLDDIMNYSEQQIYTEGEKLAWFGDGEWVNECKSIVQQLIKIGKK